MSRRTRTIRILLFMVVVFSAATLIIVTNVKSVHRSSDHVRFEAESALAVERPFVISENPDASGGRCLEIVRGTGSGVRGSGGTARYEISVPEKGKYILWARVYWLNGCSNSFLIRIGNTTFHFGEDSNFNAWHWQFVITPEFKTPGTQEITVINREDGIRIDEFVLTKDPKYAPTGTGETMYYFTFDGGRADGWQPGHQDRWAIESLQGIDGSSVYYLSPSAHPSNEFAVTSVDPKREFIYRVQARCTSDDEGRRNVRLLLKDRGRRGYAVVDFTERSVALKRSSGDRDKLVRSADQSHAQKIAIGKSYHLYEVQSYDGLTEVRFDGTPVLRWKGDVAHVDAVGIGSRFGGIHFDNILYARRIEISYSDNFYYDVEAPVSNVAGWRSQAGNWIRGVSWGTLSYQAGLDDISVSTAGFKWWSDYSYEVAFKANGRCAVGLLFFFLDSKNSYLFQWHGEDSGGGGKELVRISDGSSVLLAKEEGGYERNQWYRLRVEAFRGAIRAFIDGRLVFDIADAKLFNGRIGIMVRNETRGSDRTPAIEFWPGLYRGEMWEWLALLQAASDSAEQTVYFCHQGGDDHYSLTRMAGAGGKRVMRLHQTRRGERTLLAEQSDPTVAAHAYHYRIQRQADSISVSINALMSQNYLAAEYKELSRFTIRNPVLREGRIGVAADRVTTAEFDDIRVRGISDTTDGTKEWWSGIGSARRSDNGYARSVSSDRRESADWIQRYRDWQPIAGTWRVENGKLIGGSGEHNSVLLYESGPLHDDMSLAMNAYSVSDMNADLDMIIAGDRNEAAKGYRMEFNKRGITLSKNGSAVYSSSDVTFVRDRTYSLKIEMKGNLISGYCSGSSIFSFRDDAPIRGGDILIASKDGPVAIDSVRVEAFPYLQYEFDLATWAATDFCMWDVEAGRWDEIPTAGYRLFGEKTDERDAVLWHKEPLPDSFTMDMYLAPGEYVRRGRTPIRFCAKRGCNAYGYELILDFIAHDGKNNTYRFDYQATLIKNGRVCGRTTKSAMSASLRIALRVEKLGSSVRIVIENEAILEYVDSDPPRGDMLALGVGGDPYHPVFFEEMYITAR